MGDRFGWLFSDQRGDVLTCRDTPFESFNHNYVIGLLWMYFNEEKITKHSPVILTDKNISRHNNYFRNFLRS